MAGYSEVDAQVYVSGRLVATTYSVATQSGGRFATSVSATETVQAGAHEIRLCVAGRGIQDWTVTYSVSVVA